MFPTSDEKSNVWRGTEEVAGFFVWKNVVREEEEGKKTSINFKSFFLSGEKSFFFAKKNFKEGRGKSLKWRACLPWHEGRGVAVFQPLPSTVFPEK